MGSSEALHRPTVVLVVILALVASLTAATAGPAAAQTERLEPDSNLSFGTLSIDVTVTIADSLGGETYTLTFTDTLGEQGVYDTGLVTFFGDGVTQRGSSVCDDEPSDIDGYEIAFSWNNAGPPAPPGTHGQRRGGALPTRPHLRRGHADRDPQRTQLRDRRGAEGDQLLHQRACHGIVVVGRRPPEPRHLLPGTAVPDTVGSVHEPAITAARAAGLASGLADGSFGPDAEVRRDRAATARAATARAATARGVQRKDVLHVDPLHASARRHHNTAPQHHQQQHHLVGRPQARQDTHDRGPRDCWSRQRSSSLPRPVGGGMAGRRGSGSSSNAQGRTTCGRTCSSSTPDDGPTARRTSSPSA